MILLLIGFVLILYSMINYKKAFMLFVIYQMFWFSGAQLLTVDGLPTITIGLFMNIAFLVIFLLKHPVFVIKSKRFPFARPFWFVSFSLIISCFFALVGFTAEFTRAINLILQNIIIIWIMWHVVESREDFNFIFKGITLVFLIACLFGMYEYVVEYNPFIEYKSSLTNDPIKTYSSTQMRGYRMMSIFEHTIGAGMTLGLYCVFVFTRYINEKEKIPYKYVAIVTALLCIPCLFLTKMRSAFVFTFIVALSFVNIKKKRFRILLLAGVLGIIISWPLLQNNLDVLFSLFDKTAQKSVGGSTVSQRIGQFKAIFELMKMSPITGLGEKFGDILVNDYTIAALDYESIWFEQMARHGIIGILANVYLAYWSIWRLPRKYHSKEIFFVTLSYWFTYTLTSVPSFRIIFYYYIIFYFIKGSEVYKKSMNKSYMELL